MYDFNFADLLVVSKRNWKLLGLSGLVGLIVIGALTMFVIPQKWSAEAAIALGNQTSSNSMLGSMLSATMGNSSLSGLLGVSSSGPTTDLYTLLLMSWDTRRRVVEKCGLQKLFKEDLKDAAIDDMAKAAEVDATPPASCTVMVTLSGTPRGLFPANDKDLQIRKKTVECVNAYTQALTEELAGLQISPSKTDRLFLEQQMPQAKAKFDKAQIALTRWEAKNHLPSPTTAGSLLAQELMTVIQAQVTAQIQAQGDASAVAEGQRLLKGQKEMVLAGNSESLNPQIVAIANGLAAVDQQLAQQEIFSHKTAEHPDVKQLEVQKQELMRQLTAAYKELMLPATTAESRNAVYDTMRGAIVAAQVDKIASDAKVRGLNGVLNEGKHQVETLAGASLDYARLWEDVVLSQSLYETITKNYEAMLLTEKAEEPIFFVVDPPVIPYKKTSPSTVLAIVIGLLLGLIVGVNLSYRKERRLARQASTAPADAAASSSATPPPLQT
jgi:uncharacterized protein involved in exopolysaccharide biosynthesis